MAMHELMTRLWPICRSITGDGVRETLNILKERLPELTLHEVPTGTKCFDWTVPNEWSISSACLTGPDGEKLVDFDDNNLHVVNYSSPVDRTLSLDELQPHLHSLPDQPGTVPYVTSYYKENWGFCLPHSVRKNLRPGDYRAVINSSLTPGSLTYGELILEGRTDKEILISTYICHPSMANNELSGPVLGTALAEWVNSLDRNFTYRFLFVPETIGAICYLSRHLDEMRAKTIAGFVLTCVGDERAWSFMPSRNGETLADRTARHVLKRLAPEHTEYSFLQRGSDERQYCSPGVDLPVCSVMRSKYMTFPEYHTSLDNLEFVTAQGLADSYFLHQRMIETLEGNCLPKTIILGEPKMSDRGLRPTLGKRGSALSTMTMMNLIAYSDGLSDLVSIGETIGVSAWDLVQTARQLADLEILELKPAY